MKLPGDKDPYALNLTGFSVIAKPYSAVRDIFAELGEPEYRLKDALKVGFGIDIDNRPPLQNNPMLYFVQSEEQMAKLKEHGIENPTFLQILGTTEVVAESKEEAIRRYRELKGDQ